MILYHLLYFVQMHFVMLTVDETTTPQNIAAEVTKSLRCEGQREYAFHVLGNLYTVQVPIPGSCRTKKVPYIECD